MPLDFDQLTRLGKIRRMHSVVEKALQNYDLDVKAINFLTIDTNTHFKIRTPTGERYVLRIYSDEETTLKENKAEFFWLNALVRDSDLNVSEPVARKDGEYLTLVTVPGVPPERRCALFRWIPGRTLEEQVSPENYYKLGGALAKLHDHAASLNPLPPDIAPKRWDKVFYYPDEPVVYNTPAYSHLFTREDIQTIDQVILRADDVFQRLFSDRKELMLIHGDLHYWNAHIHQGKIYLIDFEDINLGYPVQDIAVTLSYGWHRAGYEAWKAAFIEGYTDIRPWPDVADDVIPTLTAARTAMFINYVARIEEDPQEYIQTRMEMLRNYLRSQTEQA